MFTIKQVAGLTGVSEATLRAWQGRYGIVTPKRSAGGYRLYSEEQVALLREMASLVAAGVPASRAAVTLLQAGAAPDVAPAPGEFGDAGAAGEALLRAAADLDPVTLAVAIADAEPDDFEVFADRWLPLRLRELGDAWAAGVVGVAGEHFVCAGLMRAIAAEFERAPTGSASGRILVGLPPGARHEVMLRVRNLPAPPRRGRGLPRRRRPGGRMGACRGQPPSQGGRRRRDRLPVAWKGCPGGHRQTGDGDASGQRLRRWVAPRGGHRRTAAAGCTLRGGASGVAKPARRPALNRPR